MFVPATWFLPLALSNLWPQLLTWNFHIIPGNFFSNTWNRFSSDRFLITSGIFVYCFDKQTFPKLLAFTSHTDTDTTMSPTPNFSLLYCYDVVIRFELEQFVECILFCYFTFYFVLSVCYAHLAACVFVQLLHDLKQHVVKQVSLRIQTFHTTAYYLLCKICCMVYNVVYLPFS